MSRVVPTPSPLSPTAARFVNLFDRLVCAMALSDETFLLLCIYVLLWLKRRNQPLLRPFSAIYLQNSRYVKLGTCLFNWLMNINSKDRQTA